MFTVPVLAWAPVLYYCQRTPQIKYLASYGTQFSITIFNKLISFYTLLISHFIYTIMFRCHNISRNLDYHQYRLWPLVSTQYCLAEAQFVYRKRGRCYYFTYEKAIMGCRIKAIMDRWWMDWRPLCQEPTICILTTADTSYMHNCNKKRLCLSDPKCFFESTEPCFAKKSLRFQF